MIYDDKGESYLTLLDRFRCAVLDDQNLTDFDPYIGTKTEILTTLFADLDNIVKMIEGLIEEFRNKVQEVNNKYIKVTTDLQKDKLDKHGKPYTLSQMKLLEWYTIEEHIEDFTMSFDQVTTHLRDCYIAYLESNVNTNIDVKVYILRYTDDRIKLFCLTQTSKCLDVVLITNKQSLIDEYYNKIKDYKEQFDSARDTIAPKILKKYTNEEANYGRLENSKIKYPTYNLSLLHNKNSAKVLREAGLSAAAASRIVNSKETLIDICNSARLSFIKEHMEEAFTKLYTKNEIINGEFLMENKSKDLVNILAKYLTLLFKDQSSNIALILTIEDAVESKLFDHVIDNVVDISK